MWSLSPDRHHLNHGSWGAVPVEVQAKQADWRRRWEENTTGFVLRELEPALAQSRLAIGEFLGADPSGIGFTRNATAAVAGVVRSIEPWLSPGDEIVTTSHDYNAVRQTLEFTAARLQAKVIVAPVSIPLNSPDAVTNAVLGRVTATTRLVVIDHITSPTGLVYPVEEIVGSLEPDIPVLVDGAHGPGQVPLDLERLGASWYAGNLHKWVCAPKGSGFLYSRDDRRNQTYPVVVSHAWNQPLVEGMSRYQGLFDWTGTDDITSWLAVPDAIQTVGDLHPGGWPGLMSRNHELALAARELLLAATNGDKLAPDEMVGSMAALWLSDARGDDPGTWDSPLWEDLFDSGFETAAMIWPHWPHQMLRISAHVYNELAQYQALADHLNAMGA